MKAIVLSSGGLDSTTCLAMAVDRLGAGNVSALSVSYGQKHARELSCARKVAEHYGVAHYELDAAEVMQHSRSALLKGAAQAVPHGSYAEQMAKSGTERVATYVPFRNGLMLSMAASLAAGLYEGEEVEICLGAHADDAAGNAYPDCGKPFLEAMGAAVKIGTYGLVRLAAPFAGMGKAEVVRQGLALHVPYELTWSCYEDGERPCGQCATCIDRAKAFAANGVPDPALAMPCRYTGAC